MVPRISQEECTVNDRVSTVTVALFAAVLIIGGAYVYLGSSGSHDCHAEITSDGKISYELTGSASEYRYSVFSDTKNVSTVYLYLDEDHVHDPVSTGSQKEFLSVISKMLEKRGVHTEYADSQGLRNVMKDSDSVVLMISGALPNTVYGDSTVFEEWMTAGGTIYWAGPEIGRYVSTLDGLKDLGKGYFDGNVCNAPDTYGKTASDMLEYTGTIYYDCSYGIKADLPNTKSLSFISDDGYSSVTVSKLFNGNVTVFGGDITESKQVVGDVTDRTCCADLIVCGLTYKSEGLDAGHGTTDGKATGVTSVSVTGKTGVAFFICTGTPASDWSKCIRF